MTSTPASGFRLYYIDDSGAHDSGYATFTWLQLDAGHWAGAEQLWMHFRAELLRRHGLAPGYVLHATDLIAGRTAGAEDPDLRFRGARIVRDALTAIAGLPGLSVGTVYRQHEPHRPGRTKYELYQDLVAYLDADLRTADTAGMVFLDGGRNKHFVDAHRALDHPGRRLIEEPQPRPASADQWVQMADIAAFSAYQSIARRPSKHRLWAWYPAILGHLDRHGGPIPL